MKTPIFVREMTADEIAAIKTGLRSSDGFVVRRSQIVWSSSQQETARKIAKRLGCDDETVRKVIKQFNAQGLKVLRQAHGVHTKLQRSFRMSVQQN